jgi:hypothetical protein
MYKLAHPSRREASLRPQDEVVGWAWSCPRQQAPAPALNRTSMTKGENCRDFRRTGGHFESNKQFEEEILVSASITRLNLVSFTHGW